MNARLLRVAVSATALVLVVVLLVTTADLVHLLHASCCSRSASERCSAVLARADPWSSGDQPSAGRLAPGRRPTDQLSAGPLVAPDTPLAGPATHPVAGPPPEPVRPTS